jgi:hypothetical protein
LTLGIGEGAAKIEAINGSGHRSGERAHQCEIRAQSWILIETRGTSMIANLAHTNEQYGMIMLYFAMNGLCSAEMKPRAAISARVWFLRCRTLLGSLALGA